MDKLLAFTLLLLFALSISCSGNEPKAMDKLVFMAGFKAQANLPFVAVYVAQDKEFFAEQNLEVEIRHAATGGALKFLAAGEVDVTTSDAGALLQQLSHQELPVIAITLFGQNGQQAFVTLADSGIDTLQDWPGRRLGYKGSSPPPEYFAMLKDAGIDHGSVELIRVGYNPRVLTDGDVDILAVFKSNEPDTIRNILGREVVVWDPRDYGVPIIGLTYVTRKSLIDGSSDLVERFLKASLKGLQYAVENPDDSVDIVMEFAPKENREHQVFMLATEIADAENLLTDSNGLGWMTDGQWEKLYDYLMNFGALPKPFEVKTAYTDRFLKEIYKDGKLNWP